MDHKLYGPKNFYFELKSSKIVSFKWGLGGIFRVYLTPLTLIGRLIYGKFIQVTYIWMIFPKIGLSHH